MRLTIGKKYDKKMGGLFFFLTILFIILAMTNKSFFDWTLSKVLIALLIPASLSALAIAFWKRSLLVGIAVMVFIALAKMSWSVVFGGESGKAVLVPAMVGLVIYIILIYIGFRRMEKRKNNNE